MRVFFAFWTIKINRKLSDLDLLAVNTDESAVILSLDPLQCIHRLIIDSEGIPLLVC